MCGIVGIVGKSPVNQALYDGLTVLQHRGQDAAGIVTVDNNTLRLRKANGLVKDVFETRHMQRLAGNIGIGHVRYPTAGSSMLCHSSFGWAYKPHKWFSIIIIILITALLRPCPGHYTFCPYYSYG
ncbi:Amidophosphoribosyltransferase [Alishewanella longhuensis]